MNDPIVDEVHKARIQLWERCGKNWDALVEYFDECSRQHPERMVTREELEKARLASSAAPVKPRST